LNNSKQDTYAILFSVVLVEMSFGGPPPNLSPPTGPFEATLGKVSASPYTIALAIFLLNIGGRFLPAEITKGQEAILNQPWFRRFLIYVIFFVATRNVLVAFLCGSVTILIVGYLFNENSSLCLFGKGGLPNASCKTQPTALTPEEQDMLAKLTAKAAKIQQDAAKPLEFQRARGAETHDQYQRVLRGIWQQMSGF
jgi:hypothetical protein